MKLSALLNTHFWKHWLKHYAPRRFNYAYATKVLHFRERKNKRLKRLNKICVKKGHTRDKYLNPSITKKGVKINLPNYTKSKYWYIPRSYSPLVEHILSQGSYDKIIKAVANAFPGLSGKTVKKLASYFLNKKKKKLNRELFVVNKSVFEELQFIPKKEIDEIVQKFDKLKIKGDQI